MVNLYSISTIRKKVREYGKKINAPKNLLTVRTSTDGFGTPHIEMDENGYNYVVYERGQEHERKYTTDISKLLYWIFELIVFEMANEFALKNRKAGEDHRRELFAKEIELFEKLDSQWVKWKKKDINNILKKYPYDDNP